MQLYRLFARLEKRQFSAEEMRRIAEQFKTTTTMNPFAASTREKLNIIGRNHIAFFHRDDASISASACKAMATLMG